MNRQATLTTLAQKNIWDPSKENKVEIMDVYEGHHNFLITKTPKYLQLTL